MTYTVAAPTSDASACLNSQPSMCVVVGSVLGSVQYSGLTPGAVGVWQINLQIPSTAPTGAAVPIRVVVNGVSSNSVTIAIR